MAQSPYNEKPSYGRSRDFDLQHLKLELSFDLPQRKIIGTATLRMAPLAGDVKQVALDSAALDIDGVTVAGRTAKFRTDGRQAVHHAGRGNRPRALRWTWWCGITRSPIAG